MFSNNVNSFNYSGSTITNNNTTSSVSNFGIEVTSGSAGIKGSWTNLMPSTYTYIDNGDSNTQTISKDIYLLEIISGMAVSNRPVTPVLSDIGIDPSGGSDYTIKVKDLLLGPPAQNATSNISYRFPIFIKAGSSIALRTQTKTTGGRQIRVGLRFWGLPTNKESIFTGSYVETIGQNADGGTSITTNVGSFSTWTSLGVTKKDISYWNLGITCDNSAVNNFACYFNLSYGQTKKEIMNLVSAFTSSETVGFNNLGVYHKVKAGTEIFCKARPTATQTGVSVIAYGVG